MESNFLNHPSNAQELGKTLSRMTLGHVFAERKGSYLNEFTLFIAHFNAIPNLINEIKIDCKRARRWFADTYQTEIRDQHYFKGYFSGSKKAEVDDIFYILYEDLIVDFDTNCSTVRLLFRKTDLAKVDAIIKGIKKFRARKIKRKPEISLLVNGSHGIETKELQISKPRLSIADNYNNDFKDIHETIIRRLSRKNDKGLVLLHGKPGTGKTSYIRYLITILKKKVIFLPPNMAGAITNPNLISILIDNPNCILVIEDAENIVVDREKDGDSPVSALLNISDGLLSDCLNIQIICSFNTDITKIDSALMRKGRLVAKYEFSELEIHKANILSRKLGISTDFDKPMSLAAIYNQSEIEYQEGSKNHSIGFKIIENIK